MKTLLTMAFLVGFSSVFAASLNEAAMTTILNSSGLNVEGDIQDGESVLSIYNNALNSHAKIVNECEVQASKMTKCTLWMTNPIIGETAIEYFVNADGSAMLSNSVLVSRGD